MATAKKKSEQEMIVERLSAATTTQQTRKLSELKPCKDFQNRPQTAYKADRKDIQDLGREILAEGLITPYLITPDNEIVDGHRRKAAQDFLVASKADGYTTDPDVAVVVMDGSKQDYLVAGLASNCQQHRLGDEDTLNAIDKLLKAGVDRLRTQKAANLSSSQWARYAAVLRYPEAKTYVDNDELSLNVMSTLVMKAEGKGSEEGAKKLLKSLEPLVEIERKAALAVQRRFANSTKNPPSSEVIVKNRWPRHLIDAWYFNLDSGLPICGEAEFVYGATILEQRGIKTLSIPGKSLVVSEANYEQLQAISDALALLVEDLDPLLDQLETARLLKHGDDGRAARIQALREKRGKKDLVAKFTAAAKAKAEQDKAKAEQEKARIAAKAEKAKAVNSPNLDEGHARIGVEEVYGGLDPEQARIDEYNAENPDDLPTANDEFDFDEADSNAA